MYKVQPGSIAPHRFGNLAEISYPGMLHCQTLHFATRQARLIKNRLKDISPAISNRHCTLLKRKKSRESAHCYILLFVRDTRKVDVSSVWPDMLFSCFSLNNLIFEPQMMKARRSSGLSNDEGLLILLRILDTFNYYCPYRPQKVFSN